MCIELAQKYHRLEVRLRRSSTNVSLPILKLSDKKAIELGSSFIGEFVVFATAGTFLVFDHLRTAKKEKQRKEKIRTQIQQLQEKVNNLESQLKEMQCK